MMILHPLPSKKATTIRRPRRSTKNDSSPRTHAIASRRELGEESQDVGDHASASGTDAFRIATRRGEDAAVRTTYSIYSLAYQNDYDRPCSSSVTSSSPPMLESAATQQDDLVGLLLDLETKNHDKEKTNKKELFSLVARRRKNKKNNHACCFVKKTKYHEQHPSTRQNYRPLLQIIDSALEIIEDRSLLANEGGGGTETSGCTSTTRSSRDL